MLEAKSEDTIPCYIGQAKPMNERPAPLTTIGLPHAPEGPQCVRKSLIIK